MGLTPETEELITCLAVTLKTGGTVSEVQVLFNVGTVKIERKAQ